MGWLLRVPGAGSGDHEAGAAVVEYAMLLAFITLIAFVAMQFIGGSVSHGLSSSGSSMFPPP
ncbi:MAG: hypothetical protein KGJ77_08955 [Acidobacteriota bacterium]|nr:hypothetical protein [Acidobacteriota bacterium]